MDFELIKKILRKEGGKIIIVEDGNPTMIVSSFEEYAKPAPVQKMAQPIAMPAPRIQPAPVVREEKPFLQQDSSQEGLTIDDLPF